MNFTADYANDLLRKMEIHFRAEGKQADFIYSDNKFIQDCQRELDDLKFLASQLCTKEFRLEVQQSKKYEEIDSLKRCRQVMKYAVYRRMMDTAVRRLRKITQRCDIATSELNMTVDRIKELEVVTHAQATGLRRFWDHPEYKMERLSAQDLIKITSIVGVFFVPEIKNKAA